MALKLITHGITIVSAKGPDAAPVALAQAGPGTQSVDIGVGPRGGGYPTVTTRIRANGTEGSGAETDVEVPLSSLPVDRRRGWSELPCDLPNTLVYILYGEQGDTVIYLHSPNPADWMAGLPDSARLSEIAIPGSHESTALHGYFISKCQTVDAGQQLNDGIRFLDVRVKINDGDLQTFHGIRPEYSTLRAHIDMAEAFLRAHPSETLIMCVKEEGDHRPEFSARVYQTFREKEGGALWSFAPDYVPTLGEVRGRGIIFTRFGKEDGAAEWADGMGIHPPSWPDDRREGFTLDGCFRDGVSFRCHDWYGVPNITQVGEKASAVAGFLEPTLEPSSPQPLTMVFNTASTFPGAPPQWISCGFGMTSVGLGLEGTNARLTAWLLSKITEGRRPRATVMLDFYQYNGGESGLAALLVAVNFI